MLLLSSSFVPLLSCSHHPLLIRSLARSWCKRPDSAESAADFLGSLWFLSYYSDFLRRLSAPISRLRHCPRLPLPFNGRREIMKGARGEVLLLMMKESLLSEQYCNSEWIWPHWRLDPNKEWIMVQRTLFVTQWCREHSSQGCIQSARSRLWSLRWHLMRNKDLKIYSLLFKISKRLQCFAFSLFFDRFPIGFWPASLCSISLPSICLSTSTAKESIFHPCRASFRTILQFYR